MTTCDVFFYEAFTEEAVALQALMPAHVRAEYTPATIQEYGVAVPPASLISIRTQSLIPVEWAGPVDAILARTTGYDHLIAYRQRAGTTARPVLGYLPLYCARAVAEQAILLAMALMRKLPRQTQQFQTFLRDHLTGSEMQGKTMAVVGVGHIGGEIVRLARGLGMQVLGVDPVRKHPDVTYATYEEAAPVADVIVCSMNLTASNRHYFDYTRLKAVKRGGFFINVARGEMSPSADLLRLLEEGFLAGVALDVYEEESLLAATLRAGIPCDDSRVKATVKLCMHPRAILTPHNAFNTMEAVARKAEQTVQQVVYFLGKREFLWSVPQ